MYETHHHYHIQGAACIPSFLSTTLVFQMLDESLTSIKLSRHVTKYPNRALVKRFQHFHPTMLDGVLLDQNVGKTLKKKKLLHECVLPVADIERGKGWALRSYEVFESDSRKFG